MEQQPKNNFIKINQITPEDTDGLENDESGKRAFLKVLGQFLKDSSLHGSKHIAVNINKDNVKGNGSNLNGLIVNIAWIFITVSSGLFSAHLMHLVWVRYQTNPTVISVETINYPIWDVPFPAVTVCNINKVHLPSTNNIIDLLKNYGVDYGEAMQYLGNLSKMVTMDYVAESNVQVEYILERLGYTADEVMFQLVQPCADMIQNCSWLGKEVACNELFRMIKTSKGFCCSFNYKGLRDSYKKNYDNFNMSFLDTPTLYVSGAGEFVSLIFMVDTKPKYYVSPTQHYFGAEVLIHGSLDFPDNPSTITIVQPGEDLRLAVEPQVTSSMPDIRYLDVQQRGCYFEDEAQLTLSQNYSYDSCIAECKAEYSLDLCHCLSFYFPIHRPAGEAGYVRQCGLRDLFCLRANRYMFYSLSKDTNLASLTSGNATGMNCKCLPACSDTRYQINPSVGQMDAVGLNKELSMVYVYFSELTCVKFQRDPYLNWDGLLAAFGGIFGLALGGSVLSLLELLYFFIFKFYVTFQAYRHDFQLKYLRRLWNVKEDDHNINSSQQIEFIK